MPQADTLPPTSPPDVDVSTRSLTWLFAVFLSGLLLVVGLKVFFADLQAELNARSSNERARLFAGEEIVRGIQGLEKDTFKMAATTNTHGVRRVQQSIEAQLVKLEHDLQVLQHGGTIRREIDLNIEGRDRMVREVSYTPVDDQSAYVMELVEIAPLLDQTRTKVQELEKLLQRRWTAQDNEDKAGFYQIEEEISNFLKHMPPYFARLDENANRLFFDSTEQLRTLEAELSTKGEKLKQIEMGLVLIIILLATLAGILFVRRIKSANRELELALSAMAEAKNEAERASRAKSEFVSRMSHELRTPLNAIIGFAELLETESLAPSQLNQIALINRSGKHLMELINQVLDHAKIEAGSLTLEDIPFDFAEAIDAVRTIVTDRANSKGLTFLASIDEHLPHHVRGDPTRLRQILINLLTNAVKFTEHGSVELRIAKEEERIFFSVRDTGIGMDQSAIRRLFQPFGQADESISRKYGGTGLGLLISKELIEAMGGGIEVESAPHVGTCFWFWLPLQAAEAPPQELPAVEASPSPPALRQLVKGRILVVDDNRVNQQLAAAMLARLELEFDMAGNGRECLEAVNKTPYSLILMDMEMPEMDGITATLQIRADEAQQGKPALPIIAMTANALHEDREKCFKAGMNGYIAKPISLNALTIEIQRILGETEAQPPESRAQTTEPASALAQTQSSPQVRQPDRQRAIDMIGDADIYDELAQIFIADAPQYLRELEQACAASDWPSLTRHAHTLKGLFGTFAFDEALAEARQLEDAAKMVDIPTCQTLTPMVARGIQELVSALAPSSP